MVPGMTLRLRMTLAAVAVLCDATRAAPYLVEQAYIPGSDVTQVGIVYRDPEPNAPAPGLIVLHGWTESENVGAALVAQVAFEFQQRRYATLALSLRGWPATGGEDDCGGRQADDIVVAARWFAARAYVDRVAVVGHSQGGQVALLAAARGAPVEAVVAYAAPSDVAAWGRQMDHAGIKRYVSTVCSQGAGTRWRSPLYQARQMAAPVLLVHGDQDRRVPHSHSSELIAALRRAGKVAQLLTVPGAGHALDGIAQIEQVDSFLSRYLRAD